jgi:hypothetical protein
MNKLLVSTMAAFLAVGAFAAPKSTTVSVDTKSGVNTASNISVYVRGEVKSICAWNDNGATGTVAVVNGAAGCTLETIFSASISSTTVAYSRPVQVGTTAAGVAMTASTNIALSSATTTMLVVPYVSPYVVSAYATITQTSGVADKWHITVVYDDKSGI